MLAGGDLQRQGKIMMPRKKNAAAGSNAGGSGG